MWGQLPKLVDPEILRDAHWLQKMVFSRNALQFSKTLTYDSTASNPQPLLRLSQNQLPNLQLKSQTGCSDILQPSEQVVRQGQNLTLPTPQWGQWVINNRKAISQTSRPSRFQREGHFLSFNGIILLIYKFS